MLNADYTRRKGGMKTLRTYGARLLALLSGAFSFISLAGVAHAVVIDTGTTLSSPLNSAISSIPAFIATALKVMVMVALPILTIFIVLAGFEFIWAQGNPGEIETAKKNFFYVILGALLILGAWVIATLIAGTISQLTA